MSKGGSGVERKRRIRKILSAVSIIIAVNLLVGFLSTKLVYDSVFKRYDGEADEGFALLCETGERSYFPSGDNMLCSYFFDTEGDTLVVVALGMNTQMSEHTALVEGLISTERDVFIFDMTGCGESEGESAKGFSQVHFDLNCALDYIESEYSYDSIFLLGHSRGGYGAVSVLSERDDVTAVASVSAPNSPMEAVIGSSVQRIGGAAYANYPMLYLYQTMLFDRETVSLSCADIIESTSVPVLVVHGTDDSEIPTEKYSLYSYRREVRREGVEFVEISGDHGSVLDTREMINIADEFFCKYSEKGGE